MDPLTVGASVGASVPVIIKTAETLSRYLSPGDQTKFGVGDPDIEKTNCNEIHVFMTNVGYTSIERRRRIMAIDQSITDAKEKFGRTIDQTIITDENKFEFAKEDQKRPLYYFSNGCRLNLNFTYEHSEKIVRTGGEIVTAPFNYFKRDKSPDNSSKTD